MFPKIGRQSDHLVDTRPPLAYLRVTLCQLTAIATDTFAG